MSDRSLFYRKKALAAEQRLLASRDADHRAEWMRIAFEWHIMASEATPEPTDIEIIERPAPSRKPK